MPDPRQPAGLATGAYRPGLGPKGTPKYRLSVDEVARIAAEVATETGDG